MKYRGFGLFVIASVMLVSDAWGYSPSMRRGMVGGPWELVISKGMDEVRFPVTVDNESKPADLGKVLPLLGSPMKIRIEKYLPDLQWNTYGAKADDGGIVVKMHVKGPDLDTDLWLDSSDPKKSGIISRIGGLKVVEVNDAKEIEAIAKLLCDSKAIGIVSVWLKDAKKPIQVVARKGKTESIGDTKYKLKFLDYIPHYSIDRETKKVTNASDKPVNPALQVRLSGVGKDSEQWLWSKFPSSPHAKEETPVRMEFSDVDYGGEEGKYLLLGVKGGQAWVISAKGKKKKAEKLKLNQPYSFTDKAYSFDIAEYFDSGKLVIEWENGSESLKNPAIIVVVEKGDKKTEHVLEVNKRVIHTDDKEMTVLLFAKKMPASGMPPGMGGMPPGMPPGMGGMKKK
jgi:hypothetical protein